MATKDPNSVTIQQLDLVLQMLPLQEEAIRKTLASMRESKKEQLPTSNWKSSGLQAMRLLQRFTTGIAGMIETGKAEILMRELEEIQPVDKEESKPQLSPKDASEKNPRSLQSSKIGNQPETSVRPRRKAPKK
jgi:hypothetical protein